MVVVVEVVVVVGVFAVVVVVVVGVVVVVVVMSVEASTKHCAPTKLLANSLVDTVSNVSAYSTLVVSSDSCSTDTWSPTATAVIAAPVLCRRMAADAKTSISSCAASLVTSSTNARRSWLGKSCSTDVDTVSSAAASSVDRPSCVSPATRCLITDTLFENPSGTSTRTVLENVTTAKRGLPNDPLITSMAFATKARESAQF